MTKATADMAYLARELCDRVFGARPRSVVFLDPQTGHCVERWFDAQGRHEGNGKYCAFEMLTGDEGRWVYACENHDAKKGGYTRVELRDDKDRYTVVGPVVGEDPGPMFKQFGACIQLRHTSQGAAPPSPR